MKELIDKIKPYITIIGWISSVIVFIWGIFGIHNNLMTELRSLQKLTLRNTIWNENIPFHDRMEACDTYIELGYNSETKKYCNDLLEEK